MDSQAEFLTRFLQCEAVHHDTKLGLADFTGTGKAAVAAFGASAVGAPDVYIRRRD